MKFCALVSGGKDSCMNLLYCQKEGHELVVCANLHPKPNEPEEIDSFMFQTVGSSSMHNLAECLGVPLYTHEISDASGEQAVDDVVAVLSKVLKHHPEIKGVSVGAIASVYQQIRVDKACAKLGLISLAFLWQRDQKELLTDIIQSGMDARIIKVAGIGLDERHLNKSLAELQPYLLELNDMYGFHPCGEGGEYETMVFDGPQFKNSLEMLEPEALQHSNDDVFYLSFKTKVGPASTVEGEVSAPPFWDEWFDEYLQGEHSAKKALPQSSYNNHGQTSGWSFSAKGTAEHVAAELAHFYQSTDVAETIHVGVILRDMAKFKEFNEVYLKVFAIDDPPSRKCISAEIPHDVEITVFGGARDPESKCLHVQGLSYWAPANIGPYSQSRTRFGLNFLAGQIGLVPSNLELLQGERQPVLALQNAFRILNAMHGADNWQITSAIVYIVDEQDKQLVEDLWNAFSRVPLIVCQISSLPRGASAEWDLTACDLKYISGHPPDEDELEEKYEYKPRFYNHDGGYACLYGDQLTQVGEPGNGFVTTITTCGSDSLGLVIPARNIWYNGKPVKTVSLTLGKS